MNLLVKTVADLCHRLRKDVSVYRRSGNGTIGRSATPLTFAELEAHVNSDATRGLYLIRPGETTTRVAVLDLDSHKGEVPWEMMLSTGYKISESLKAVGLTASPWRSGGGNGIHLWIIWDEPQDAYSIRQLLEEILLKNGLTVGTGGVANQQVEIYPRQDSVEIGRFGSQVWLPLSRKSVLLLEHPLHDLWYVGERESAANYVWPISQPVPIRQKPAKTLSTVVPGTSNLPKTEIERLRDILKNIGFDNAGRDDYTYDTWLAVGMALHHATGGQHIGLSLWSEWSVLGASYDDESDLQFKWDSFRLADSENILTVRSLEHMARGNGWVEDVSHLFTPVTATKITPLPLPAAIIPNERNHLDIAKRLIQYSYTQQNLPCLIRNGESSDWFTYNGKCYDRVIDETVTNELRRFLTNAKKVIEIPAKKKKDGNGNTVETQATELTIDFNPTASQISAIFNALKTAAEPNRRLTSPCWRLDNGRGGAVDYISLQDGILHFPKRTLMPHTPELFSLNVLPYGWNSGGGRTEPALWLKFLSQVLPDQETINCLQEMMGYLVSNDTRYQKMFFIKGLPRSGKGTIERVTRAMLGDHNVAGTTLNQLGGEFGLWPLIDKTAVFISEARNTKGGSEDKTGIAIERLLMISGEDSILINTKGGKYQEHRLKARVVMTANDVPHMGDSTGAFASRFITMSTQGTWLGNEDDTLTEKLCAELPTILRWALDGLDRLRARGRFVQPESGKYVFEELADAQNPIRRFLKESCVLDGNVSCAKRDLYDAYRFWFHDTGMNGRPTSHNWFSKALRTAYREVCRQTLAEGHLGTSGRESWMGIGLGVKRD